MKTYTKQVSLYRAKNKGPCFLLDGFWVRPPDTNTKSLLVLRVDTHKHESPEAVDKEEIVWRRSCSSMTCQATRMIVAPAPKKIGARCPWVIQEKGCSGFCPLAASATSPSGMHR